MSESEKAATRKSLSRQALKKAADPILAKYQAGTKVVTGALVGNELSGTRLNRRQSKLNRKAGKAEVEVHVGTADPAGIQEEFGNVHQAAHPSLRPAWDSEGGDRALERIGTELGDEIKKTAARQSARRG